MEPELLERIERMEKQVQVLVALAIDRHLRDYPELGSAKAPKIEHVLDSAGLTGAEIGALLGKTRQAVSQNLSK